MAKTKFVVKNLNPDFPHVDGFWLTARNDGGIVTQGTIDPSDDTYVPAKGTHGTDDRGTWVWCNETEFEVDGDVNVAGTNANLLKSALDDKWFYWLPENTEWNRTAPFLKDGVTANPDYDRSQNPLRWDQSVPGSTAWYSGDKCLHFEVSVEYETPSQSEEEEE